MFKRIEEIKEYHKNGQLMYESKMAIIEPMYLPLYPPQNRVMLSNGEQFVRIGTTSRYWDNGQLNWRLDYDKFGTVISNHKGFQRDGKPVNY